MEMNQHIGPYVGIVGSREFPQLERVADFVRKLAAKYPGAVVVSGGARGVDRAGEAAAERGGLEIISFRPYGYENMSGRQEFSIETLTTGERAQEPVVERRYRINPPHFPSYGRAAFHRNRWIVECSQQVVAFTTGSKGTANTLQIAQELGVPTHVYRPS